MPPLNAFWPIVIIGIISEFSCVLQGAVAAGEGLITIVLFHALSDDTIFSHDLVYNVHDTPESQLHALIIMLSWRSFFNNLIQVKLVAKNAQWDLAKFVVPICVVGAICGAMVLDAFGDTKWLRPAIGAVFTLFGLITLAVRIRQSFNKDDAEKNLPVSSPIRVSRDEERMRDVDYIARVKAIFIPAAVLSSFMGGLCNTAGPALLLASLYLELPLPMARGTIPICGASTYIGRMLYNVFKMITSGEDDSTTSAASSVAALPLTIAMVSGGVVGLWIGDALHTSLDTQSFLQIAAALLLLAGLSMFGVSWIVLAAVAVAAVVWIALTNKWS